jgi:hypothetical protein
MKELEFDPHKSASDFRKNYKLHDLAEIYGKNLLIQWGVKFADFGGDNRFQKVWEKGEDKPDLVIEYKGRNAFLDWKGKHKPVWLVNKRAAAAYERWRKKFNVSVFVAFAVLDDQGLLLDFRIASLGDHKYTESEKKQWDKNLTVRFDTELPGFTKPNLLKLL